MFCKNVATARLLCFGATSSRSTRVPGPSWNTLVWVPIGGLRILVAIGPQFVKKIDSLRKHLKGFKKHMIHTCFVSAEKNPVYTVLLACFVKKSIFANRCPIATKIRKPPMGTQPKVFQPGPGSLVYLELVAPKHSKRAVATVLQNMFSIPFFSDGAFEF
jgi:hypothetical protein